MHGETVKYFGVFMWNFMFVSLHCLLNLGFTHFWHPTPAIWGPEPKEIQLFD